MKPLAFPAVKPLCFLSIFLGRVESLSELAALLRQRCWGGDVCVRCERGIDIFDFLSVAKFIKLDRFALLTQISLACKFFRIFADAVREFFIDFIVRMISSLQK